MTRQYDFIKEVEIQELDIQLYKKEQEEIMMKQIWEELHSSKKVILGKSQPRYKNRTTHDRTAKNKLPF